MGVPAPRRRKARRRLVIAACGTALVVPVVAAGWLGVQVWQAADELAAAVPIARELVSAVADSGDGADVSLDGLRAHAARADELTDTPLWRLAEAIPGIGADLAAVRTVAAQLAVVSESGLEPVLGVAEAVRTLDLGAVADAREPLARAATALGDARTEVDAIDASSLLPPVAEGVTQLQSALGTAAPAVDALAQASAVLPGMLGTDGPRSILVMLQNNAEARTGGGITGAFVELRSENGALTLVRQAESAEFAVRAEAIAPVADATNALYGDVAGRFVQNATMPADFSVSAQLASAWWQSEFGVTPDAVIAIDPLVLQALLATTGPVTLADGSTIGAENVVSRLLVDPYRDLDPQAQTAYLQEVSGAVFGHLASVVDPVAWAGALAPAIEEGRVSVWSSRADEQAVLATSAVGGPRARHDAAGADAYAVYLNDATGGKMGSYLDVAIEAGSCEDADVVRATITNTVSPDAVAALPMSVTGGGLFGTAVGDIGTNVTVSAPAGAAFGGVSGPDGPVVSADVDDAGHPSSAVRVNVSPGESETVVFRFVRVQAGAQPTVLHTPLMNAVEVSSLSAGCDG